MVLEHILSELNNVPSISDPYRELYNEYLNVSPIEDEESLDGLIEVNHKVYNFSGTSNLVNIDLRLVEVQVKVAMTFTNSDSEEDFFI